MTLAPTPGCRRRDGRVADVPAGGAFKVLTRAADILGDDRLVRGGRRDERRMKIGDTTTSVGATGETIQVVAQRAARALRPAPADAARVDATDVAEAARKLLGRVDDTTPDPARAAQVEILRNAVASGRYQPDLHEVARKLLVELAAEPRR
jgi:anti-sigma28 factor (negative regulator of flagellin synthesis)